MPIFGPEVDAERARAHMSTHLLAQHPERIISDAQLDTLLDSPWPDHQLDAGWVHVRDAMRARRSRDIANCFQNAREAWELGINSPAHTQSTLSQLRISLSSIDLWRRVKRGEFIIAGRDARREIDKMHDMHSELLSVYLRSEDATEMDTVGPIAEAVCMDALNRLAIERRSGWITVPSESWNDTNYARHSASYDIQQLSANGKKKVQVKLSSASQYDKQQYDDDIAVVYLDQHWPGEWASVISEYMMMAPLDDERILGAADSMQRSIDYQLSRPNRTR